MKTENLTPTPDGFERIAIVMIDAIVSHASDRQRDTAKDELGNLIAITRYHVANDPTKFDPTMLAYTVAILLGTAKRGLANRSAVRHLADGLIDIVRYFVEIGELDRVARLQARTVSDRLRHTLRLAGYTDEQINGGSRLLSRVVAGMRTIGGDK